MGPGTRGGGGASGPNTKPGEKKQRDIDWETHQRFQLARGPSWTGRERALSAAKPMAVACG